MKRHPHPHSWLATQLESWQTEGWVSIETAEALRQRYPVIPEESGHRLSWVTVILGVFGSLLVMSGIILLFAHNWHDLSRGLRTVISVTPLIVFQGLGVWTLWRHGDSVAWREGVGIGLTLSIGAAIALIAQTYQLGGDFGRFMLVWTLLTLPVVYLLRSGTALWAYLIGAVVYAGYMREVSHAAPVFFGLYLAVVPLVIRAHLSARHPVLAMLGRYALALAIWAGGALAFDYRWEGAWLPIMVGAAGAMILWDRPLEGRIIHLSRHPFTLTASLFLGSVIAVFSFADVWRDYGGTMADETRTPSLSLIAAMLVGAAWLGGMIRRGRQGLFWPVLLGGTVPALALIGAWLAARPDSEVSLMLATNGLGLLLGVVAIVQALREDRISLLNYGIVLVGGLVLLRFFDSDLGFLARGLGFIGLGLAFLLGNLLFVRHRRERAQKKEVLS